METPTCFLKLVPKYWVDRSTARAKSAMVAAVVGSFISRQKTLLIGAVIFAESKVLQRVAISTSIRSMAARTSCWLCRRSISRTYWSFSE